VYQKEKHKKETLSAKRALSLVLNNFCYWHVVGCMGGNEAYCMGVRANFEQTALLLITILTWGVFD